MITIRIRRCLPSLLVTFGLVLGVLSAGPPAAAADADRPWTIPALKQWTASSGSFTADAGTRVVAAEPALAATARTFALDLGDLLGRRVRVVRGPARPHDVVLRTDRSVRPKAEGYRLNVAATTVISGATDTGVFWGTRSLLQLITQERTLPAGTAKDWPDYPYRGISLCNCSKFFSVPWLVRLIKDMSYLKYNELHLEMRVAGTEHPENDSATAPTYSPAQVREIVSAGERYHVQVVQQVGTPGHMDYYLAAHPELQTTDTSGARNASNLDMSDPSALPYVKSLLDEQLPQFPGGVWYGGGDEYLSSAADYEQYPSLAKWAQERAGSDAPAADSWVLWQNQVHDYVASKGRTLHVWNDQLFEGMPTKLDAGVAVDYWIHQDGRMTPAEIAANGNDLVNVSDSLYYASGGPPNAQWIYETFTPGLFQRRPHGARRRPTPARLRHGRVARRVRRQRGHRRAGHVRSAARARPEELGFRPAHLHVRGLPAHRAGHRPRPRLQIAYTPDGTVAYAAVGADGTVVPILTASGETGPPIKVGSYPIGITIVG